MDELVWIFLVSVILNTQQIISVTSFSCTQSSLWYLKSYWLVIDVFWIYVSVASTIMSFLVAILQNSEVNECIFFSFFSKSVISVSQSFLFLCLFCFVMIGYARYTSKQRVSTLGRLGWICPELVAPHLQHFCKPWYSALFK